MELGGVRLICLRLIVVQPLGYAYVTATADQQCNDPLQLYLFLLHEVSEPIRTTDIALLSH